MKDLNQQQLRTIKVLENIIEAVRKDPDDADVYADVLEPVLDDLASDDFYGTEGQCDPRGDFRNGIWSMWCIEGIDESLPSEDSDWDDDMELDDDEEE